MLLLAISFDMILKNIITFIENKFPLDLQESYDNCGLTYGHPKAEITGILVCLDVTEDVVSEAIQKKCNLIISHHPVLFKGLKSITGKSTSERVIETCIKSEIYLYALHTNLDNHYKGVNNQIANTIGLKNLKPLAHKSNTLVKLVVYVPESDKKKYWKMLYLKKELERLGIIPNAVLM
jgi:dinuclear metal center YbgI/SA1388 family protein